MKMIVIVSLALVAAVAAHPVQGPVAIVRSSSVADPAGGFQYSWEAENGIKQVATGELKTVTGEDNKPQTVVVIRGSYTYPVEGGKPIEVSYYADENGYHAEGESIPKPL